MSETKKLNNSAILEPIQRRRTAIEKLTEQLRIIEGKQKALENSIQDHKAFMPEVEIERTQQLESASVDLSQIIATTGDSKTALERRLKDARATKSNPLFVWKYFTSEQRRLRYECNRLQREISKTSKRLLREKEALSKISLDLTSLKKRISEYESFDIKDAEEQLAVVKPKTQRIASALTAAKGELKKIEKKVEPHLQELERLEAELANFKSEIAKANLLENSLSAADNSYEKAKIHQECEEKFGFGSPKRVINDRQGGIRRIKNNIPKRQRRIREELKKLDRTISHLIVDGNNVCYEGKSFIGLRAVTALLQALGDRFKVTVVFDASIRRLMKTDNQGISELIGPKVATHVAPTKTAADEFLMKLAGRDKSVYIFSNDRFSEYHDYDAVKSDRVLRFLIADDRLMANELDISVDF